MRVQQIQDALAGLVVSVDQLLAQQASSESISQEQADALVASINAEKTKVDAVLTPAG